MGADCHTLTYQRCVFESFDGFRQTLRRSQIGLDFVACVHSVCAQTRILCTTPHHTT
jgi:hypothetical protein